MRVCRIASSVASSDAFQPSAAPPVTSTPIAKAAAAVHAGHFSRRGAASATSGAVVDDPVS